MHLEGHILPMTITHRLHCTEQWYVTPASIPVLMESAMTNHTWPSSRTTQSRAGRRDRKDVGPASKAGASTCSLGLPTHLKGAPTSQQASFTGTHLDPHPPAPTPLLSLSALCPQLHPHVSLQCQKLQFPGNLELSLGLYGF